MLISAHMSEALWSCTCVNTSLSIDLHQPFVGNRRGAYILFCKCSHYCLVPRTCCAPATACTLLMHYLCGASCHCFFLSDAVPDSRGWYRRNGAWEWQWGVGCFFIQVHSFLFFFLLGTGVETFVHYRRRPCVRVRCYRLYLEHIVRRVLARPRSTEANALLQTARHCA